MEPVRREEDRSITRHVRTSLDTEIDGYLRAARRWMTSVHADHESSLEWQRRLNARECIRDGAPPLATPALEAAVPYGLAFHPGAGTVAGLRMIPYDQDDRGRRDAASVRLKYLNDGAGSIYAGSNEIQRNIIAEAQLDL